jgi:hypothetical protein
MLVKSLAMPSDLTSLRSERHGGRSPTSAAVINQSRIAFDTTALFGLRVLTVHAPRSSNAARVACSQKARDEDDRVVVVVVGVGVRACACAVCHHGLTQHNPSHHDHHYHQTPHIRTLPSTHLRGCTLKHERAMKEVAGKEERAEGEREGEGDDSHRSISSAEFFRLS